MADLDKLLSARELSGLLGISPRTPYDARWRRRVGLRALKVGGILRFRLADVERLIVESHAPLSGKKSADDDSGPTT